MARLVVRDALRLIAAGLCCGLAAALAIVRPLRAVLYDVNPGDPIVFVASPLVLLAVCAIASWIPAWTAIRINAAAALRSE